MYINTVATSSLLVISYKINVHFVDYQRNICSLPTSYKSHRGPFRIFMHINLDRILCACQLHENIENIFKE